MNLLTNICNPKDQHFEQEQRTETYKPLGDYIFQNRSMQKMRAKYQKAHSTQEFKYQSWNHPYSISNYLFQQKTHDGNNLSHQQAYNVNTGNAGNQIVWRNDGSHNKKISFKDVNMPFCGVAKQGEQGEKHFKDRNQYYAAMQGSYPSYGHKSYQQQQNPIYNQQHQFQPQQFSYQHQNMNITSQSYSNSLLNKQLIQLKQENKQLKRVIEEEYKPLKQLYNKLLTEQQEREYLISKLEWKVRELVKEMGVGNGNGNGNGNVNVNVNGNNTNMNGNVNNMNINGNVNNLGLNVSKQISNPNQNYTTIEKNPFPNINNNHQQYKSSNYTNISTYFPQNNNPQRPVLNQFQPLNISTIPFANDNNNNNINNTSYHQHVQSNNYHLQSSSSYQPFVQQKTNNLSKSSIIGNNTLTVLMNNTQPVGYKNNPQFLQNVPPQQNYHHNVSQMSNF